MDGVVKSAGRVMAILEAFDAAGHGLRVSDIVERLGIPQSSASALIKSLNRQGFLDQDPDTRTYRPSARVAMLGTWVLGSPTRSADLLNLMRRLYEETGQSVVLAIQNGVRVQYINVLESSENVRFTVNPGTTRAMHLASVGIMLLSLKRDDEISRLLRHANAVNEDDAQHADLAGVMAMVETARRQGWFLSDSLATANSGVLSVILPADAKARPIAIGLGGTSAVLGDNRDSLLETLNTAIGEYAASNPAGGSL